MKARVKATGETIEVMQVYEKGESFYVRLDMLSTTEVRYHISELEFEGFETEGKFAETCLNGLKQGIMHEPDYWTRLEHQYAGMAMQGILSNPESELDYKYDETLPQALAECSVKVATALVKKLKNE